MNNTKKELRKFVRGLKNQFNPEELIDMSTPILEKLEEHPRFKQAHTVLLYHSLPDEVYTHRFIERWSNRKELILPVVAGEELILYQYTGEQHLKIGSFGICEPSDVPFLHPEEIELSIIPGMAFDKQGNRLGRGKGYYDRLLPQLVNSYNIGICFGFQLLDDVPHEEHDRSMDEVIC